MKLTRLASKATFVLLLTWALPRALSACTPTGFVKDSINLTAALINPTGVVSGDVDATGCNIGIYYGPGANGHVNDASIHSANYYGVVNNGAHVKVENSTIYDIGESPLNGTQHGVAIYFAFQSDADGDIIGNVIWNYQKGGIVVNGPSARSNVIANTVIGQGPVNFIAQNGIQFGYGSHGSVVGNIVVGNSYTGAGETASGGIILVGGAGYGGDNETGISVRENVAVGNDVGIWFSNLDENFNPVAVPTNDEADHNTVRDNSVNNTSGNGPGAGYQAGISDQGDGDSIVGNSICGVGYTPVTPPPYLFAIDVTATNNPTVKNNTTCNAASPVTGFVHPHGTHPDPHR